ncbi:expressed unknown protein [Seminavis robusta]|uniref:Uncharacterized protein n=1 Tax=Seminavis robusta TaxID=568900 RepID=A0A9N8HKU9_9STRA|nr:expressed unknown protein [Seminavis robusta]|eukprot:Sro779_g201320.1 n/a (255) ;mRNA; r:27952-28860
MLLDRLSVLSLPVDISNLWYALLVLQLIPSALRICKGIFYPVCAGYALGHTWQQKLAYIHCTLPWWIANKLSDAYDSGGNIGILLQVCSNERIREGIQAYMQARTLNPGDVPADDHLTQMSDYGGSYVTQLYLFGNQHVQEHLEMHKIVSFVAHILDDFVDRKEDKINGQFNYFNDHPVAVDKSMEHWIDQMQSARDYFVERNDVAMVRFIDGSCAVTTLFHPNLYQLVYKNPDCDFGNPLGPLASLLVDRFSN